MDGHVSSDRDRTVWWVAGCLDTRSGPAVAVFVSFVSFVSFVCGCGYPEFQFQEPSGSSAASTASGSGMGGTPRGAGAGGASGGGAGRAGAGGAVTAGAGGGSCVLGAMGACGAGKKCSVVDESNGNTGCVTAGTKPLWNICLQDADCEHNVWCDHGVCKPVCEDSSDCQTQPGQQCVEALNKSSDAAIPGLRLCTSYCEPTSAAPCGEGTTCVPLGAVGFDCQKSSNVNKGGACDSLSSCAAKLACVNDICERWCKPVGGFSCFCDSFCLGVCNALDPVVKRNGIEYGVCG